MLVHTVSLFSVVHFSFCICFVCLFYLPYGEYSWSKHV